MTQWCSQLLRAWGRLMTGCWLGVLDRKTLQRIDQFYYEERSMYADPDYNRSGLMDWEQQAVQTHFQKCKRLLLIGAGGGREVLALHRLGYEVDAYECHPKLLTAAQRLYREEGIVATVRFAPRDQAIASDVTYDGAVIGWGAYTLIQGRARRTALLSAVRQQLADDAPLLVSFFMRSENDRSYRFITRTANTIRQMLRRPDCIELGDDLVYNFVHHFLAAEVESELREGGFQPAETVCQGASGYAVGLAAQERCDTHGLHKDTASQSATIQDSMRADEDRALGNMMTETVSVIVVTKSVNERLEHCLDAVKRQSLTPYEILVCVTGNKKQVSATYGHDTATVWRFVDGWYTTALNVGICSTTGEYVLCLNDDAVLDHQYLEQALPVFRHDAEIGMVTGKILRFDGKRIDGTGQFPGRTRKAIDRGYRQIDRGQFDCAGYVFGPGGAAPIFRRSMLASIALQPGKYFDELFGMYYEDLDLAWRAQRAGWKAYYVPTAVAHHERGASSGIRHGGLCYRFYLPQMPDALLQRAVLNRYRVMLRNDTLVGIMVNLPAIVAFELGQWSYLMYRSPHLAVECVKQLQRLIVARRHHRDLSTALPVDFRPNSQEPLLVSEDHDERAVAATHTLT